MRQAVVILILVSTLCLQLSSATTQAARAYLVAQTADGVTFYDVDESGTPMPIKSLADFRMGTPQDADHWWIRDEFHVTATADHSMLAYTAQRGDQRMLFIDTLDGTPPREVAIPSLLQPLWSPDGSGILLKPNNRWYDEPPETFTGFHAYDLENDRLAQLTSPDETTPHGFQWLPDSSGLIFQGESEPCAGCGVQYDLWTVERDGTNRKRITHLNREGPTDIFHSICHLTWSERAQRYYYIVGCDYNNVGLPYLYSTSLAGDNRLEYPTTLQTLYPDDYLKWVNGLYADPAEDSVRVVMQTFHYATDGYGYWHIARADALGTEAGDDVIAVYALDDSGAIYPAPDARTLALTGYQSIDGDSRQVIYFVDTDRMQLVSEQPVVSNTICDALWRDADTLLYSEVPQYTSCDIARSPMTIWQATRDGETVNVTAVLDGVVGLIH